MEIRSIKVKGIIKENVRLSLREERIEEKEVKLKPTLQNTKPTCC